MLSEGVKNTMLVCFITLTACLFTIWVHEIVKEPIAIQQSAAKENAYQEVFADAEAFKDLGIDKESAGTYLKDKGYEQTNIETVMKAVARDGSLLGYVMMIDIHKGYAGDVRFSVGIRKDGTVNGISILSIQETAGYGMKAKEEDLMTQAMDAGICYFQSLGGQADE